MSAQSDGIPAGVDEARSGRPQVEETAVHPPVDPRRWRTLALLGLVQFILVLDGTVVNIALPRIGADLKLSAVGLAWIVDGYLVIAGGLLLVGGRLADLVGRRLMFMLGTALFMLASLANGLAQNGGTLIASRFVQGAGEAMAAPAALSIVALLFREPTVRAKAFGIWGGIAGLGAVFGLLLSGVITDLASWRWVFLINIPIAIVALVLVPVLVSRGQRIRQRRIDLPGAVLVTGGMIAMVYGLLHAGQYGWSRTASWGPIVGGLAALGVFVAWEARTPAPLVPLRFFTNRTRIAANICTVLVAGSTMAMFFLVVLYMQGPLGFSPLQAGLAYMPFMVTFTVGLGLSTQLFPKLGARNTIAGALVIVAIGMFLLARIEAPGSYWTQLVPATLVLGLGLGLVNPAISNAALHRVSAADAGLASGVQTTVMQVGSATGISVLVALAVRRKAGLIANGGAPVDATVAGYRLAFTIAGVALLIGAIATMVIMERTTDVVADSASPPLPIADDIA